MDRKRHSDRLRHHRQLVGHTAFINPLSLAVFVNGDPGSAIIIEAIGIAFTIIGCRIIDVILGIRACVSGCCTTSVSTLVSRSGCVSGVCVSWL